MTEWVLVPREPTAKMVLAAFDAITNASGEGMIRARWRCMLDAAPAAPQQAEPVAWMKFGGSVIHTMLKRGRPELYPEHTIPLYLHPPAAEVQRLRDALTALLDHYVSLVASGDAGKWDAEQEPQVIAARRALGGE